MSKISPFLEGLLILLIALPLWYVTWIALPEIDRTGNATTVELSR